MRSHSFTWTHKALFALLSTTALLLAAAEPLGRPHTNLVSPKNDQTQMSSQHTPGEVDPNSWKINYGSCYYFTNPQGEHLGSDGGYYSYLKFGSHNQRRPFRLCKDRHDCSHGGPLEHKGNFYLLDFQGSSPAKGKNIIAGNHYGYMYPSFNGYTNYLHFKAYNDCDTSYDVDCYVRLKLKDQSSNYNGLEINGYNYPYLSNNDQKTISVMFHPVQCPDDDDDDGLEAEL